MFPAMTRPASATSATPDSGSARTDNVWSRTASLSAWSASLSDAPATCSRKNLSDRPVSAYADAADMSSAAMRPAQSASSQVLKRVFFTIDHPVFLMSNHIIDKGYFTYTGVVRNVFGKVG
jgi:hypothetical protein